MSYSIHLYCPICTTDFSIATLVLAGPLSCYFSCFLFCLTIATCTFGFLDFRVTGMKNKIFVNCKNL